MNDKEEKRSLESNKKQYKILSPVNDIVFQMLFSKVNPEITKDLISSLIDEKIDNIELDLDKRVLGDDIDDKIGIVDLRARLNENIECEIEMQMYYSSNFIPRLLFYWARLYSNQIKVKQDYKILKRTIVIAIVNDRIRYLNELKAHTVWKITEEKVRTKILTDKFEIHIIEIPKAIKEYPKNKKSKLLQWMMFFNSPEGMEVKEIMEENKEIKKAKDTLRELSEDEQNQRIAEARLIEMMDRQDMYDTGYEEGQKSGQEETKKEVVKELLKIKMDIEQIIQITKLTKEEIERIKKENNL